MAEDPKPNPFEHLKPGRHVYFNHPHYKDPLAAIVSWVSKFRKGVVNLVVLLPYGTTEPCAGIPYDDSDTPAKNTWRWMFEGQERVSTAGAKPSILEQQHAEQVALNAEVASELDAMQSEIERRADIVEVAGGVGIPAGGKFAALAKKPFDRGNSIVVPLHFDQSNADDPWKNRSAGMRCRTCMWFVPKVNGKPGGLLDAEKCVGRCRRHAPSMGGYPVVFDNDWCGDHRLDERKA